MRFVWLALIVCFVGCVAPREEEPSGPLPGMTHTTGAEVHHWEPGLTPNLRISPALMRACALRFGEVGGGTPHWFDPVGLSPIDEDMLLQLSTCVTVGPLKGHALALVAATSPHDANVEDAGSSLIAERADHARRYLIDHGLPPAQIGARTETDAGTAIPRDGRIEVDVTK